MYQGIESKIYYLFLGVILLLFVPFANATDNFVKQAQGQGINARGLTRDNFDYHRYAKQALGDNRKEYNDAQKDYIYKDAVESTYKELKTDLKMSSDDALKRVGEIFVDGYEVLGKHRPKDEVEQRKALTLEGFNEWVKPFIENNQEFKDYNVTDLLLIYFDEVSPKKGYTLLKNKGYASAVKKHLKEKIKEKYGDSKASSILVDDDTTTRKMFKSAAVSGVEQLKQMIPSYTYNKETAYSSELADSMQALDKIDVNKEIDVGDGLQFVPIGNNHYTENDKIIDLVAKIRESKNPIASRFQMKSLRMLDASEEVKNRYNKATPEERKAYIDELKKESTLLFNKSGLNKSIASDEITTSERRIAEYDDPNFSEGQKIVRDVIANAPQAVAQVVVIAVGSRFGVATVAGLGIAGGLGAQSGMVAKTQALRDGATEEESDKIGILTEIAETGTQFAGGKLLEPLLKAGGGTIKNVIKSMLGEGIPEGVNAPLQEYIKSDAGLSRILKNNNLTTSEKTIEMLKLAGHSAAVGAVSAGVISAPIAISQQRDRKTK